MISLKNVSEFCDTALFFMQSLKYVGLALQTFKHVLTASASNGVLAIAPVDATELTSR